MIAASTQVHVGSIRLHIASRAVGIPEGCKERAFTAGDGYLVRELRGAQGLARGMVGGGAALVANTTCHDAMPETGTGSRADGRRAIMAFARRDTDGRADISGISIVTWSNWCNLEASQNGSSSLCNGSN